MSGDRRHVVAACSSWGWGGTQKQVLRLCEGLSRRGSRVDLVARRPAPFIEHRAADAPGVRIHRLPLRADGDLYSVAGLAWLCLRRRPDVLLVSQLREYLLGGLAGKIVRVPVLLRMGIDKTARLNSRSDRLRYRDFPDALVVNAERIRDHLLETPWMRDKRIYVVHNGVDAPGPPTPAERARIRREFDIPEGAVFLLGVGRFVGDKRLEWLVDASAELRHRGLDVVTVLVGGGETGPMLEQLAREHELGARFRFAGFRNDVRHWIGAADVLGLPSVREGMPNVILEAMGSAVPVVATRVGGIGELISSDDVGLLSPVDDFAGFVDNLERCASDPDLRTRLGEAGLRRVRERHGWDRMVDEYEAILEEVARK